MTAMKRILAKIDRIPDSDAVTVSKDDLREALTGWHAAGLAADAAWDRFATARDPLSQASAISALQDAMSDLASWLPGYDPELGRVPYDDE